MAKRKMMTYGKMPSWSDFVTHYDHVMEGARFRFHLKGSDARTVGAYGLATQDSLTARDLYDYVNVLVTGFNEDGDENAGSIASAMLGQLWFEWV